MAPVKAGSGQRLEADLSWCILYVLLFTMTSDRDGTEWDERKECGLIESKDWYLVQSSNWGTSYEVQ